MEEYLTQLNLERDYEEMLKHLLNKEKITRIENYFTGLNIKVLLSSFLIRNFHEYFLLTAQDNLVKNSKNICEHIMNKDLENTTYSEIQSIILYSVSDLLLNSLWIQKQKKIGNIKQSTITSVPIQGNKSKSYAINQKCSC